MTATNMDLRGLLEKTADTAPVVGAPTARHELDRLHHVRMNDRTEPPLMIEARKRNTIEVDAGVLGRGAPHNELP